MHGETQHAFVEVGGETYFGKVVDTAPMPGYPDWIEIEIVDADPLAAKMAVVGPEVDAPQGTAPRPCGWVR